MNPNIEAHIVNPVYPGRFMILGRNDKGMITIVYCLMGGSPGSQNRDLVLERKNNGDAFSKGEFKIRTEPINDTPKWVPDPAIHLYDAVRLVTFHDGTKGVAVSNGGQTDDLFKMVEPGDFESTLARWEHEGPKFDYTSRISGLVHFGKDGLNILMSIISASKLNPNDSVHTNFFLTDVIGEGHFISTYKGERDAEKKLPAFDEKQPVLMPLVGSAEQIASGYMGLLSPKYRISLAVLTLRENATIYGCSIINYGRDPEMGNQEAAASSKAAGAVVS